MNPYGRRPLVWRFGIAAGALCLVAGGVVLVGAQMATGPSITVTGEEQALSIVWEASADASGPVESRFDDWAALWPTAGAVVHADHRGVTAYSSDEGAHLWDFTPEGRGLCAAAETPAGKKGDIGVVLVEEADGDGDYGGYGNACRTVVALDLESGEEVWTAEAGPPWEGAKKEAERYPWATGAEVWADGPRVVVQRGEILLGLDADEAGREVWQEENPLFPDAEEKEWANGPDYSCLDVEQSPLPGGEGELAVLAACDYQWRVGVLDTATGEVSERSDASDTKAPLLSGDPLVRSCWDRGECRPPGGGFDVHVFDGGDAEIVHAQQERGALPEGPGEEPDYAYPPALGGGESYTVDDGILYLIASGREEPWDRLAAVDLTTGQTRWAYYAERYTPREVLGVENGRVLVLAWHEPEASAPPSAEEDLRLLSFPADGEGPAEVIADGLPALPGSAVSDVRVSVSGGRYYLALPPRALGERTDDEPVAPLYTVG
ncbi:outer membrane protein assembly factor BamB family protein [Nocardiopsis suaedae]|uniref:PQQ-binding-like beta-propeller repeat protein n=1 Tax=Nocardiopsis suaedae TaxID=3018444 RepID=A0ABT4TJ98_9ACTN|nr:PQQ-binding-like beta-propeller repeat protein [Nocardiopsis suaedae]MDA2804441.1 PQQ-binding-like beta-propeller repeat protein [Nocardiopsis suaedae]